MYIQEVLEVHKNHLKLKRAKYDENNRETIEIIDMVLVIKGSDKQMAWFCLQTNILYTVEALALACSSIASTATSTWSESIEEKNVMNFGAKKLVLLVWSLVPEETKFYLFDSGSEMATLAQKSSGFFINGDDLGAEHEIFRLNELLGTYVPVPVSELQGLNIEAVYHSGFFL